MIYYLTYAQWNHFWFSIPHNNINAHDLTLVGRCIYWKVNIEPIYHITYYEKIGVKQGKYGIIEGDEKHINWFLMQL